MKQPKQRAAGPTGDEISRALSRIVASAGFKSSSRLCDFLGYVIKQTLEGHADRIKAVTISQDVYGRPDSIDPRSDTLVRVEAGRLRRLLDHYYLTDGRDEAIRISVPKGSYVPAFEWRMAVDSLAGASADDGTPSIAVLAFDNLSGDPGQEYFSDGVTENIITALCRFPWLRVVARNSAFVYKSEPADVRRVAAELGVRYVLQGSVRKAKNQIRLTAQLIDGPTGRHLWAEHYDRDLGDIFVLQDAVTQTVVAAMEPELARAEQRRAQTASPAELDAWNHYWRAMWHQHRRTKEDLAEALMLYEKAIAADPNFALAHAGLSETYFFHILLGDDDDQQTNAERALEAGRKAVDLQGNSDVARIALGIALATQGDNQAAIDEFQYALTLNPNSARCYFHLASSLTFSGQPMDAIPHFEKAIQLSPSDPYMAPFLGRLGMAHLFAGHYEEAVAATRKSLLQPNPPWPCLAILAAALGYLGQADEAADILSELQTREPRISTKFVRQQMKMANDDLTSTVIDGLRNAGMD
jgi:TolB-like protein/cytochrome c-type biogenesis protein CcmH/NrfG